jgi:hypothetical protein
MPDELPVQSLLLPSVHSQSVLGVPSQLSSLPGTAQLSTVVGNTEQAPQLPSARQVWSPSAQLPF